MHKSNFRFKLAAVAVLSVLGTIGAEAQTRSALRGNIPFEFTAGDTLLPPGSYLFAPSPGTPWLSVSSPTKGAMRVPVITRLGGALDLRDSSLVFDEFEGRRVLSEVWIPGEGGLLIHATPKGHTHQMVTLQSGLSTGLSGKAIFERTCARCHGPNGDGNEAADKFFKTTLPRLNSQYVQTKSDDELREIVTQGRRKMDPVREGQSTVQHLMPTESVGIVIAYVRTFNKQ